MTPRAMIIVKPASEATRELLRPVTPCYSHGAPSTGDSAAGALNANVTWLLSSIARELTLLVGAALKLISTDAASSASVAESGCAVVATSGVSLSVVEGAVGT